MPRWYTLSAEDRAKRAEAMKRLNADPEFKVAHAERASEHMKRLHADRRAKGLPVGRPPDPALAALTPEQRKLYKKARACGVSRDEALASVSTSRRSDDIVERLSAVRVGQH